MENIIGVIQGLKGRTADTIYDLFFSEKRVVAAVVLYFSDLTDIYEKISPTTFLFGNLSQHSEIKMRSSRLIDERRAAFEAKSLDQILALHKASLEIDYENIVSVAIKKSLLRTSLEFVVQSRPEKKMEFWLEESQIAKAEETVKKVLPNKLR